MSWTELSRDLTTWTIPGCRTKNGQPTIVPMSAAARAALEELKRHPGLVFPSGTKTLFAGWAKAKARLDQAIAKARSSATEARGNIDPMPPWRLHDIRRTVATGLHALGVRLEVTESILNHFSGSRAGIIGVYQRHDWRVEKRAALDAWGEKVTGLLQTLAPQRQMAGLVPDA